MNPFGNHFRYVNKPIVVHIHHYHHDGQRQDRQGAGQGRQSLVLQQRVRQLGQLGQRLSQPRASGIPRTSGRSIPPGREFLGSHWRGKTGSRRHDGDHNLHGSSDATGSRIHHSAPPAHAGRAPGGPPWSCAPGAASRPPARCAPAEQCAGSPARTSAPARAVGSQPQPSGWPARLRPWPRQPPSARGPPRQLPPLQRRAEETAKEVKNPFGPVGRRHGEGTVKGPLRPDRELGGQVHGPPRVRGPHAYTRWGHGDHPGARLLDHLLSAQKEVELRRTDASHGPGPTPATTSTSTTTATTPATTSTSAAPKDPRLGPSQCPRGNDSRTAGRVLPSGLRATHVYSKNVAPARSTGGDGRNGRELPNCPTYANVAALRPAPTPATPGTTNCGPGTSAGKPASSGSSSSSSTSFEVCRGRASQGSYWSHLDDADIVRVYGVRVDLTRVPEDLRKRIVADRGSVKLDPPDQRPVGLTRGAAVKAGFRLRRPGEPFAEYQRALANHLARAKL